MGPGSELKLSPGARLTVNCSSFLPDNSSPSLVKSSKLVETTYQRKESKENLYQPFNHQHRKEPGNISGLGFPDFQVLSKGRADRVVLATRVKLC